MSSNIPPTRINKDDIAEVLATIAVIAYQKVWIRPSQLAAGAEGNGQPRLSHVSGRSLSAKADHSDSARG